MTKASPAGTPLHSSSSQRAAGPRSGRRRPGRRRYRTANAISSVKIRIEKNALTPRRKKYRASTLAAAVEACSGKRGNSVSISARSIVPSPVSPEHGEDEPGQPGQRGGPAQTDRPQDREGVPPRRGIVVVAEQQELVDRRADPVARGFHETQSKIARRKIDSVEVSGDHPLRREEDEPACVSVLILPGIVEVAESGLLGQPPDRALLSRQEVPSLRASLAAVAFEDADLLGGRQRGRLGRVEAQDDDAEILARSDREGAKAADEPFEHQVTEHRTAVINKSEDGGSSPQAVREPHGTPLLVLEHEVEGELLVQPLIEADSGKCGRPVPGGVRPEGREPGGREPGGREMDQEQSEGPQRGEAGRPGAVRGESRIRSGHRFPPAGERDCSLRSDISSMALSIGIRAMPALRSIQP